MVEEQAAGENHGPRAELPLYTSVGVLGRIERIGGEGGLAGERAERRVGFDVVDDDRGVNEERLELRQVLR
jgi:hypothetical protein